MKKIIIAILALASMATAHATDMPERQLNFVAGVGFTYGGDKLADGSMKNNDLRAGKGLVFNLGADFRVSSAFSLQSTIGLHIDAISSSYSGNESFKRYPVEALAYFHPSNRFRVGGGLRYAGNAKSDAHDYNVSGDFGSKVGGVIEGELMVSKRVGLKLRYVNEKFTRNVQSYAFVPGQGVVTSQHEESVKGDHIGFISNFYF
jgi:hypothetical protein